MVRTGEWVLVHIKKFAYDPYSAAFSGIPDPYKFTSTWPQEELCNNPHPLLKVVDIEQLTMRHRTGLSEAGIMNRKFHKAGETKDQFQQSVQTYGPAQADVLNPNYDTAISSQHRADPTKGLIRYNSPQDLPGNVDTEVVTKLEEEIEQMFHSCCYRGSGMKFLLGRPRPRAQERVIRKTQVTTICVFETTGRCRACDHDVRTNNYNWTTSSTFSVCIALLEKLKLLLLPGPHDKLRQVFFIFTNHE